MFRDFFKGRYGMDNLNITLILLSAIFVNKGYIWIIGIGLLCYAIFRAFSKDTEKRNKELQWFSSKINMLRQYFSPLINGIAKGINALVRKTINYTARLKQRKNYVFVNCEKCKKTMRLPRNRGNLQVTCPTCKHLFNKKT